MNPAAAAESFPLESPPPGKPWHRASATLGHHIAATALMTMGWRGVPKVTLEDRSRSGGANVAWFMAPRTGVPGITIRAARSLVIQARTRGPNGLAAVKPDHPFLAAMAALENLAGLIKWMAAGGAMEATMLPQGRYFSLMSDAPETVPVRLNVPVMGEGLSDGSLAAALIACGFPFNAVAGPDGQPMIFVGAASITFPGLTAADALRAAQQMREAYGRPGLKQPLTLPGYPAEEHPFFYAYHAVLNYPHHRAACVAAAKDPDLFLRNPFARQRTAIITQSVLGDTRRDTVRRAAQEHLRKQY